MTWHLALCLLVGTAWSLLVPAEAQPGQGLEALLGGIIEASIRRAVFVPFDDFSQRLDGLQQILSNVVSQQENMQQALDGISSRLNGVSSRQESLQQVLDGVSGRQERMQQALNNISTCQMGADQALESVEGAISQLSCLSSCPDSQWKTFDGNCYWLSSQSTSWENARSACKKIDSRADLVSIHSREEHHFLLDAFRARDFWIGLNDLSKEGTFAWSDGSEVDFQNWSRNQPDNHLGNQDCVWIYHRFGLLWDDKECPASLPFICKITGAA